MWYKESRMKIENKEVLAGESYLDPVTYVPSHANGNAGHKDCQRGVIINVNSKAGTIMVLYCNSRTVQSTRPEDLVWG